VVEALVKNGNRAGLDPKPAGFRPDGCGGGSAFAPAGIGFGVGAAFCPAGAEQPPPLPNCS
jgi:hypothetical protein